MKRTPNTFRGHVLLAAAQKDGLEMQGKVAERLFQAYFANGEDVGDPAVLSVLLVSSVSQQFLVWKIWTIPNWWLRSERLTSVKSPPVSEEFRRSHLKDGSLQAVRRMNKCWHLRLGRFKVHLANVRMAFARLEGEHLLCGLRNFDFSTLRWLSDDSEVSQQDAAAPRGPWRPLRVRRRDGGKFFVDTQAADTYLESFKVDTWPSISASMTVLRWPIVKSSVRCWHMLSSLLRLSTLSMLGTEFHHFPTGRSTPRS